MESLRKFGEGVSAQPGERLLGPAFAHTSVGMAIADAEGRFIEANGAFLAIVGRSMEELLRETTASMTYEEDRATNVRLTRSLWSGEIPDFELEKR